MSVAEVLLVIGTFGICTGVWTTLIVILRQNSRDNKQLSKELIDSNRKLDART